MSHKKLAGKIAVITGGSSGIGLATAKLFIEEGAYVFITGRRQEALDAAVKELGSEWAFGVQGDVSSAKDLDRLVDIVKQKKGQIDVYFANAGAVIVAPFGEITEATFDSQFNGNVKSVVLGVQKALPLLREGSSVVINGSVSSMLAMPGLSVYGATKAALRSFAKYWALEVGRNNIRVNVVSPGPVFTPGHVLMGSTEEGLAEMTKNSPLGRAGRAEEIAKAVLFLGSDDSSYITGIDLVVDGGLA